MALKYKVDILQELKSKGFTSYRLRKEKILGEAYLTQMRRGEIVSKEALNTLCRLLNLQPGDIIEYVPDEVATVEE